MDSMAITHRSYFSSLVPFLLITLQSPFAISKPITTTTLPPTIDIAIVGAGLAGLSTAHHILSSQPNASVIILEARNRVGGKVYNQPLKNGGVVEVGAQFVGPTQDKILALLEELGLETFDTYDTGKSVLWRNETRIAYTPDKELGGAPPVATEALVQIATVQAQLNGWAAELNTSAPWTHPKAEEWDSMTLQQFLDEAAVLPDTNFVLETASKAFAEEPRELSLLFVLAYIAAAGNETTVGTLGRLTGVKDAAQERRVVGGMGLLPQRLAERIGSRYIALNAAVSSITETRGGYTIVSRAGTIHAKRVVLAMPPPLLTRIAFSPPLPAARHALNHKTKMPSLGKGIAIFPTPFWRASDLDLNGQVISDQGASRVTFDTTPRNATAYDAILGFILGDEMRALDHLSAAECESKILADFTRYFSPSVANMTEFVLHRWALEEYSWGAPTAIAPPGVFAQYGHALREKVGEGLYFAGTETSTYWMGYMEGALRSGERVAGEILGDCE